ncbi:hypothetical protein [Synechococcus sp. CS-1332]|uniref:hypothetical protein n=1 Tax=Synechococcus sp. CS-1332 TaxID=2847972 RepID=UPI00223BED8E|nr:hypothetical protein [Synechococcus sp. CS-1332]MCT0208673.1 hypothetical protein [Synechococcus sp. CS-1332]
MGQEQGAIAAMFDAFPQQISMGGPGSLLLAQKPGWYALHGQPLPEANVILLFEPEAIAVLAGTPAAPLAPGQAISPVYAQAGSDELAVPTGVLFLRVRQGERAKDHRAALEQAGCRIASLPDHAPEAAWLRASSGRIADALGCLDRLRDLPGVESIEPQLLRRRAHR